MFKRIKEIFELLKSIEDENVEHYKYVGDMNGKIDTISSMVEKIRFANAREIERKNNLIEKQEDTIKQLVLALQDKYKHGLFIFSEDGNMPMVIRNGKELTNDLTSSFILDWSVGNIPDIYIEQCAATKWDSDI